MRRRVIQAAAVGAVMLATWSMAQATLLSDRFGVNPQLETVSGWAGYRFVDSSLTPTKYLDTVDYQIDDWFGTWPTSGRTGPTVTQRGTLPAGEEPYDTEAYYFDNDETNLYFAIIMGCQSPTSGLFVDTRFSPPVTTVQGDFALDVPGGTGATDGWGFGYDYGVDLTHEQRPVGGNVSALRDTSLGAGVYQTTSGSGAWYLGTPSNAVNPNVGGLSNAYTNFDPTASGLTSLGNATVSWYKLDLQYGGVAAKENNWNTYVIEMTVPRTLLATLNPDDLLQFHWLMGCRNEGNEAAAYLTGKGDIDTPEPGTMALLALGLGPLGVWVRRKRKSS
jgi:hypothetical protein